MKYKIGQKVTTPLGNGEVVALGSAFNGVESYRVKFTLPKDENGVLHPIVEFPHYHLKPYKTPHERLLEMGFEKVDTYYILYKHEDGRFIEIDGDKTYIVYKVEDDFRETLTPVYIDSKLSHILTDYLEWLEEQK